jgi:hypothetical protein
MKEDFFNAKLGADVVWVIMKVKRLLGSREITYTSIT